MAAAHLPSHNMQQQLSPGADQAQINRLAAPAQQLLSDCSKILVFTADGQVLFAKSCQVLSLPASHLGLPYMGCCTKAPGLHLLQPFRQLLFAGITC